MLLAFGSLLLFDVIYLLFVVLIGLDYGVLLLWLFWVCCCVFIVEQVLCWVRLLGVCLWINYFRRFVCLFDWLYVLIIMVAGWVILFLIVWLLRFFADCVFVWVGWCCLDVEVRLRCLCVNSVVMACCFYAWVCVCVCVLVLLECWVNNRFVLYFVWIVWLFVWLIVLAVTFVVGLSVYVRLFYLVSSVFVGIVSICFMTSVCIVV